MNLSLINKQYRDAPLDDGRTYAVECMGIASMQRNYGKAGFVLLRDDEADLQVYFKKDELGDDAWEQYKLLDLGHRIKVHGKMMRTKTGELTVCAVAFHRVSFL